MRYRDRTAAGRALVDPVRGVLGRGGASPLVLGLPRGGVPVAAEVARGLHGDLDVLVVRKVGAPGHAELAMGAVASGGVRSRVEVVVQRLGISPERLEQAYARAEAELGDREAHWRGGRAALEVAGRDVVLVDDGLATGASMLAAVDAVRRRRPARLVVAVPVGADRSVADVAARADAVVCPLVPADFRAVGLHYADFDQTSDAEVRELLAAAEGAG